MGSAQCAVGKDQSNSASLMAAYCYELCPVRGPPVGRFFRRPPRAAPTRPLPVERPGPRPRDRRVVSAGVTGGCVHRDRTRAPDPATAPTTARTLARPCRGRRGDSVRWTLRATVRLTRQTAR